MPLCVGTLYLPTAPDCHRDRSGPTTRADRRFRLRCVERDPVDVEIAVPGDPAEREHPGAACCATDGHVANEMALEMVAGHAWRRCGRDILHEKPRWSYLGDHTLKLGDEILRDCVAVILDEIPESAERLARRPADHAV